MLLLGKSHSWQTSYQSSGHPLILHVFEVFLLNELAAHFYPLEVPQGLHLKFNKTRRITWIEESDQESLPHEITRTLVLKQNPQRNADKLYSYFLLIALLTKSLPFQRKLLHSAHKTLKHKIGHGNCTTAIWRPSLKLSPLLIHAVEKRLVKSQLVPVLAHFNAATVFSLQSGRLWHAVCSKIQSSQIFIQSNHFGVMQFNLIFQTYSNNPKKHSIQTHVSQFNVIRVNIYSIQSRKYLFNPITKIFIQSNHGNIYSISKIFIQSNHGNIYSIQS